jgi:hypothetical protein
MCLYFGCSDSISAPCDVESDNMKKADVGDIGQRRLAIPPILVE